MDGERQRPKFGGRRAGTPNKYTSTMKEAVQTAYHGMGGHAAFTKWAKENQTEFYRIASRLIPVEVHGTSDKTINVFVNRGGAPLPSNPDIPAQALPAHSTDGAVSDDNESNPT
jgi:hypothetical protein